MTSYIIIKKEGSFFFEAFRGVVVLLFSLPHAVTSEAWLSDRACQLKQTNLEGKIREQGLSAPQSLLFPVSVCGRQQVLGGEKEKRQQVYSNAVHLVTSSDPCILHSLGCSGLWDMFVPVLKSWRHLSFITFFNHFLNLSLDSLGLHTIPWWCIHSALTQFSKIVLFFVLVYQLSALCFLLLLSYSCVKKSHG